MLYIPLRCISSNPFLIYCVFSDIYSHNLNILSVFLHLFLVLYLTFLFIIHWIYFINVYLNQNSSIGYTSQEPNSIKIYPYQKNCYFRHVGVMICLYLQLKILFLEMKNGCREILVKVLILYVWDVGPTLMISYLLHLKVYIYLYTLI